LRKLVASYSPFIVFLSVALAFTGCEKGKRAADADPGVGSGSAGIAKLPDAVIPQAVSRSTSAANTPAKVSTAVSLPTGTVIPIELGEVVDSDNPFGSMFLIATVYQDINGPDGGIAIRGGTPALLMVRSARKEGSHSLMTVALHSLQTSPKPILVGDKKDIATIVFDEDSAKGMAHRSVHLERTSLLTFTLEGPLSLK
jgi:hypothetical protein